MNRCPSKICKKFKHSTNNTDAYHVLVKLIKMSDNCYGEIKCDDNFYNAFSDIPKEKLFKICLHLSNRLYIDYDNYDEKNYTFDNLYILPQGYACRDSKITNRINIILSVIAIIIAFISLIVSLLTLMT